jgi:glutamate/tyrosine decarboxylase-like PLP-dependent enzyme
MTAGGSESIIAATMASIEFMRLTKSIVEPEIIIGDTAHPAAWVAAKYARAKCVCLLSPSNFLPSYTHENTHASLDMIP